MPVNHASLSVSDIDRSAKWYCDVLGMEVFRRLDTESRELETLSALRGAHVRTAFLRQPGEAFTIEFTQYVSPPAPKLPVGQNNAVGSYHLGFQVEDVEAAYQRMKAQGVRFKSPPISFPSGTKACYFHDPDGIILEIIQYPRGIMPGR